MSSDATSIDYHLITGEQADALGQLSTSILQKINHVAKCKGCKNPFGRDSVIWGGCIPQKNNYLDHTSVKGDSHLFCTPCVSGEEPCYVGLRGMCVGCIEDAAEEWLKTPDGAGKTADDFRPRRLRFVSSPPARIGMVKDMLEASLGSCEDARDASAHRGAEAQRTERGELTGGQQRRAVNDAGGVVAFLEAASARGYAGDCTSAGWNEYSVWDRDEREREQASARHQAEVAATAAAAAAKEEAEAAAAEAAKVEAAKVEAATAAAAAKAAKEKKKLEAAKEKAEAKAENAEKRAKEAAKEAANAADAADAADAEAQAQVAAACDPVSYAAAALAVASIFGVDAAVVPGEPAAVGEAAVVGEPVQLGILAGSKSQRQTAKKKQRKGGSSASALPLLDDDEEAPQPKKKTPERAKNQSNDAKRYRRKKTHVLDAVNATCTRIRKYHPKALTVNHFSDGAKKNEAIPHPGHAVYKSFEHMWQWVNVASSVMEEVGDIVQRNHCNSKALMALLLEHSCDGDQAKLATMLSGSGYEEMADEEMADDEASTSLFPPLVGSHGSDS